MIRVRFVKDFSGKLTTTDIKDGKIIINLVDFFVSVGKIRPVTAYSQGEGVYTLELEAGTIYDVPKDTVELMLGEPPRQDKPSCCPGK
jgi:hypothetical protein